MYFPKGDIPSDNLQSDNYPKSRGPSAATRTGLGSCCMEKITFGILPLRKIRLGSCRLVKRFWENTYHPINVLQRPKRITTS